MGYWSDIGTAPAAIYGTIISASVLAAVDEQTPVLSVALGVVVTLVVYWLAERWSELLASHVRGEPLTWPHTRRVFVRGWPMVQASYGPVLVLVVASLLGADLDGAVMAALATTIVVLVGLGATAGHRAALPRSGVVLSAAFAGLLGVLLITLKTLLH